MAKWLMTLFWRYARKVGTKFLSPSFGAKKTRSKQFKFFLPFSTCSKNVVNLNEIDDMLLNSPEEDIRDDEGIWKLQRKCYKDGYTQLFVSQMEWKVFNQLIAKRLVLQFRYVYL